jgi:hypothetical protein
LTRSMRGGRCPAFGVCASVMVEEPRQFGLRDGV